MLDIELVISRYNETLAWTQVPPFNQFRYTVYNKGPNDVFEKSRVDKVIPLENVGNECHTYLSHILLNYNSLKPITVFLPGSLERSEVQEGSEHLDRHCGIEAGLLPRGEGDVDSGSLQGLPDR